jgi:hypothetical protein
MYMQTGINAGTAGERLEALEELLKDYQNNTLTIPVKTNNVNNHIHTIYSFSPYSPTSAVFTAWTSGLDTAGIMDHDSVAGCGEFIKAGEIINMATTVGFECRCMVNDTPFAGRHINNPDQTSVMYATCHGIPHQNIDAAQQWLAPYRSKRVERMRRMSANINALLNKSGIALDFDKDVLGISQYKNGGTVTERHLLYALAAKIVSRCSSGEETAAFLKNQFGIAAAGKNLKVLLEGFDREHYLYYLLGILKSELVSKIYIDADDECPDIISFVKFVKHIGGIPAYPYLGDVGESVTGDKKAQIFEDSYLDELIVWIKQIGFDAVTYMPTRNTPEQLKRLIGLCEANDLFQISGEDINTPFQSFVCEALRNPYCKHLIESTWALIGHEKAATANAGDGMFTQKTQEAFPSLTQRVAHYAALGKQQ